MAKSKKYKGPQSIDEALLYDTITQLESKILEQLQKVKK